MSLQWTQLVLLVAFLAICLIAGSIAVRQRC